MRALFSLAEQGNREELFYQKYIKEQEKSHKKNRNNTKG
jgi:hypothetical protein